MGKLKPIKTYWQFKTLYWNGDNVSKDRIGKLFSRASTIWDCYYLDEYNEFYHEEIMHNYRDYGLDEKPSLILVRRSNRNIWIATASEEDLIGQGPQYEINVFTEYDIDDSPMCSWFND